MSPSIAEKLEGRIESTPGLTVTQAGPLIPRDCLVEIKSRPKSLFKQAIGAADASQNYFSRISSLYQGLYTRTFDTDGTSYAIFEEADASKNDIRKYLRQWEINNMVTISGVVDMLRYIRTLATSQRDYSSASMFAAVYDIDDDASHIKTYRRSGGQQAFPKEMMDFVVGLHY